MKMIGIRIRDMEDEANPINGTAISYPPQLMEVLEGFRGRPPFFLQLIGGNGYKIDIGISSECGCAQFSSVDGLPPYLMAIAPSATFRGEEFEFLAGGTSTPVDKRYCLSRDLTFKIARHFAETGQKDSAIECEEI